MSTEYIPKLLVGCCLSQIHQGLFPKSYCYEEYTDQTFPQYLESEYEMFCVENEEFIGFEINEDEMININLKEAQNLQKLAKKFKSITGVQPVLKACVWSY